MILLILILEMNKNNGNYIEKEIILLDEYRMNILLFFPFNSRTRKTVFHHYFLMLLTEYQLKLE